MKKTYAVLTAVFLAALLCVQAFAVSVGDADLNGKLEAADARAALRLAVGLEPCEPGDERALAADADGNEKIEAADARLILRAVVGLEALRDAEVPRPDKLDPTEINEKAQAFTFEIRSATPDGVFIGTGFAVSARGEIATNYHVIANAKKITAIDAAGNEYPVTEVVAVDRYRDLAVLRIEKALTPAVLCRRDYRTGAAVYSLGSSQGLSFTFAPGMITMAARSLADYKTDLTYIQHDASISGGNSGGPLLDAYGRVVGVNVMSMDGEGVQNINFALPVYYLDDLDRSAPMTMAEYTAVEENLRLISLERGEKDPALRIGGTAALFFSVVARQDCTLAARTSTDCLKVLVSHDTNDAYGWVYITAKGNVPDGVVTVYVKEAPEISYEIRVSVMPDAEPVYPGPVGTPDLGALFGISPGAMANTYATLYPSMVYNGQDIANRTGLKADGVYAAYDEALRGAGFTLKSSQDVGIGALIPIAKGMKMRYTYYNAETGVSVDYTEDKLFNRLNSCTVEVY